LEFLDDVIEYLRIQVNNYKYVPLISYILKNELNIKNFEITLTKGDVTISNKIFKAHYIAILLAITIALQRKLGKELVLAADLGFRNVGLAIAVNSVIIWVSTLRDPFDIVNIVKEIVEVMGIKPLVKLGITPAISQLLSEIKRKLSILGIDIIEVKEENINSMLFKKDIKSKRKLSKDQVAALEILYWRSWILWNK